LFMTDNMVQFGNILLVCLRDFDDFHFDRYTGDTKGSFGAIKG